MRKYLKVPEGRFEFKGSEVIKCLRYIEDDIITEEIWTKNGGHWIWSGLISELPPEGLINLIDAELSN